jgi:glutamyl-tRNA synthetase
MTVTRFAPSPTGSLHAGNIRTALVNWLYARQSGGRFLLRLDDTDAARSSDAAAAGIRDDLAWLGLTPDAAVRQSDRFALYDAALARLAASGRAYRAYETPEQLDLKRRVQAGQGLPPVYDRAALALTDADHADFAAKGVAPHWRFRLDTSAPVAWVDRVRGDCHVDPASLSDPVVRRADGTWLYMLPSVVDDIDMGVTTIVRGEDHVTNSGVQLQIFAALGAEAPALAHLPLLTGADAALSKRLGSEGVAAWRAAGFEPQAILSYLARIGTSRSVAPATTAELVAEFDFTAFGRSSVVFDPPALLAINARLVHAMPFMSVADRAPVGLTEPMWNVIRKNAKVVDEAFDIWRTATGPRISSQDFEELKYLRAAHDALQSTPWTDNVWADWTAALKVATGRKGRALFHPLRVALTGRDAGPEMAALLPLIGRDAALARLESAAAETYSSGQE